MLKNKSTITQTVKKIPHRRRIGHCNIGQYSSTLWHKFESNEKLLRAKAICQPILLRRIYLILKLL